MEITPDQVAWHRFRRSGLIEPFDGPIAAAGSLLGVQSQFLQSAGLSLQNRLREPFSEADLARLLHDERTLVRTWGQRNTAHVYAVADWATIVSATQVLSTYRERAVEHLKLDEAELLAAIDRVGDLLAGWDRGCRADFLEADPSLAPWFEWGTALVMDLARRGLVCHAHLEGGRSYFAHRDRWLPELTWAPTSTEHACLQLAERYFASYGPATVRDLAFWFGGKMTDARGWVAALEDCLVEVTVDGEQMHLACDDISEIAAPPPPRKEWPIRMLHRFDPLVLPHKDKSWLVADEHYKSVWRKAGFVEAVVIRHGRIAGTWRYDKKGKGIGVAVEPFARISQRDQKRLSQLAERVAGYFGLGLRHFAVN